MALKYAVNNSLSAITSLPSGISGGALNLISTQTASGSATIDFTSGIDSTYDSYIFKFIDIHASIDDKDFTFQADTGTNTNYNQTITSTYFNALHNEGDTYASVEYNTGKDLAQSTGFQVLSYSHGLDNDQASSGELKIYNPSSNTFVKHFVSRMSSITLSDFGIDNYVAGYFNTITPLTRFRFKMSSGNIDSGIIKMYGVS